MIRNLKMLGLAISAMFVLGAMGATAASAEFHSEEAHTLISAAQSEGTLDIFTVDAGETKCNEATYSGTQATTTTSTVSVVPVYSECTGTFGVNVNVDVNGCEYQFHSAATDTVDIVCPEGKSIEVTAPGCTVTVGSQNGLAGVTFTHAGSGTTTDILLHVKIVGIKYEEHNKGFFPTCKSNTVATSNGTYNGTTTITGQNTAGKHVGIREA